MPKELRVCAVVEVRRTKSGAQTDKLRRQPVVEAFTEVAEKPGGRVGLERSAAPPHRSRQGGRGGGSAAPDRPGGSRHLPEEATWPASPAPRSTTIPRWTRTTFAATLALATETLTGDIRDFILDRLRHEQDRRPWHQRSETEQRDTVHRRVRRARDRDQGHRD